MKNERGSAPKCSDVRRRVIYHGRVQGVGFRATCAHLAMNFPVSGWVRNRADGTVELEAQGEIAAVDSFLRTIEQCFRTNLASVEKTDVLAAASDTRFAIRY